MTTNQLTTVLWILIADPFKLLAKLLYYALFQSGVHNLYLLTSGEQQYSFPLPAPMIIVCIVNLDPLVLATQLLGLKARTTIPGRNLYFY